MGLDSFWVDEQRKPASVDGNYAVCGGMFSGHGNDSFRGKVYSGIIQAASGYSLYTDYLDNDVVKFIASKLEAMTFEEAKTHTTYELFEDEFQSLQRMFRAHADANHALTGWW